MIQVKTKRPGLPTSAEHRNCNCSRNCNRNRNCQSLRHIKSGVADGGYSRVMQAAVSSPSSDCESPLGPLIDSPIASCRPPAAAELSRLSLCDDLEEWAVFSRPAAGSAAGVGLWESQLVVRGMRCAACSLTLEQALLAVPGVVSARVSATSRRASITWSAEQTLPSRWLAGATAAGYELLPAADAFAAASGRQESRLVLWRWLVAGFCMMQVMMYAAPAYFSAPGEISPDIVRLLRWASWVLSLPVVFFSCTPFFGNALRDLKQRRISMDLPVAIGIAVTFLVSTAATFEPQGWWGAEVYFDSLTMFVFFLLTGRWLEQSLRQRTAGSLDLLMQRLPDSAERRLASGQFERVAVRRLKPGDTIRVLPGEAFPADGMLLAGHTLTDEALLTGESRPVARSSGEQVLAGSYNLANAVELRVDQLGAATRYGQIVALMEQASSDKPRLAILADRAARPFLWFVLLAALGAAASWWQTDPARALMAAVAVLIVTCPCALSLATPSAMLTTAGLLARNGVLVRRLQAIEALAGIDTVIFDKTGTLTDPRMGLQATHARAGIGNALALDLACLLARGSLHPVSRALVEASQGVSSDRNMVVTEVREVAGQGVETCLRASLALPVSGQLRLGSARFCGVDAWPGNGMQVYLSDALGLVARFELGETARQGALEAIAALKAAGMDVHLLSGDRLASVSQLASRLEIKQAQGDCTPEAKLAFMRSLQRQGRKVLMVGDGLNDGPVLAGAHVSVAIGSAVPLAQGRSDFVMPGGQLLMLPLMQQQARRCMRVVRQNLYWAASYNALCVPLALAGYLPAWLAGLGMAMSSLLVIANAARLARLPGAAAVAVPVAAAGLAGQSL